MGSSDAVAIDFLLEINPAAMRRAWESTTNQVQRFGLIGFSGLHSIKRRD